MMILMFVMLPLVRQQLTKGTIPFFDDLSTPWWSVSIFLQNFGWQHRNTALAGHSERR